MKILVFLLLAVLIVGICYGEDANSNKSFLNNTRNKIREECSSKKGSVEYIKCFHEYTPKKCKSLVYNSDKTAWARCVALCGSESFYSKTLGECSN